MGGCCTTEIKFKGGMRENNNLVEKKYQGGDEDDNVQIGDYGARIILQGSSRYTSMFTQRGKKGINQDAMTVWEEFTGDKDMIFCGVFDGHGPSGHKVARHVRDNLPKKLSSTIKMSDCAGADGITNNNQYHSLWEAGVVKSFKEMDEELGRDTTLDTYCSGATAVTLVKQGDNLIIANLGDSRALLCTRGDRNQLVPVQLTVDLKPDIPSEAERIKNGRGRVFAMDEEPEVFRIWMPEENCPGLAMSRAFGDFCLKDCGLISVPEVSYRKLTDNDEFVVLATDGVWDVLTNSEVIKIVASTRRRSLAAKMLVYCALRAWRGRFPGSKIDDCAVICLFLKKKLSRTNTAIGDNTDEPELAVSYCAGSIAASEGGIDSVISNLTTGSSAVDAASRANSLVNLPEHIPVV